MLIGEQVKAYLDARRLFIPAAIFNLIAGLSFLFVFPLTAQLLRLNVAMNEMIFVQITGCAILLFGWCYVQIAHDYMRHRSLINVGIISKLMVVAVVYVNYLTAHIQWPLAALVSGDLVFAALFWQFLRAYPES